jgi:hypothetical protein
MFASIPRPHRELTILGTYNQMPLVLGASPEAKVPAYICEARTKTMGLSTIISIIM